MQAAATAPSTSSQPLQSLRRTSRAATRKGTAVHSVPPLSSRRRRHSPPADAAELVAQYEPLVHKIACGIQRRLPRHVLRDDLVAAGMSGLWDAIRRQGGNREGSFGWYVRVRVRGAILDELRAQDWLPRRARAAAAADGNAKSAIPFVVRLDDIGEWDQNRALATAESASSENEVCAKLESERLARAVKELPDRERHIVSMHYYRGVRFKDLGAELGVSEPRVSQLHSRAMRRLRTLLEAAA
jgi:RNA polymerase sigma factor for flagellar operon FliA